MRIVVDTNILFSALINPNGTISDLIFNSTGIFDFFSPSTALEELDKHSSKLIKLSQLQPNEISLLKSYLFGKISVIDLEQVTKKSWSKAFELTQEIDEFDTPFTALTIEMGGTLWTGDKKLMNGLIKQGYSNVIDTSQLRQMRAKLDK